jgi:hypothetical protein
MLSIEAKMQNAYSTLGQHMEIGFFLNGQAAGYTANFNGLPEMLNDNSTASWDGSTYSTYGTITRGGTTGATLNSAAVNVAGTIEYATLEENYGEASLGNGDWEPNLIVTTFKCYSYIKEKFQAQQRFENTQDPALGFNGLKFNNATIVRDRYCPGSFLSAASNPVAVGFMTEMTANSGGAVVVYPTITTETLWILNARKPWLNWYISDDPEYQLGFTGWKPSQANTKIIGQVLYAGALTGVPRMHKQLYGISG